MRLSLFCLYSLISLIFSATHALAEAPIGLVAGAKTGTYYHMAKDIAQLAKRHDIPVTLRESSGSIDNLQRMVKTGENAALGIVQADILSFLLQSNKPKSQEISRKLRAIAPLFKEEIHILANRSIHSIEQLAGKQVIVGNAGSGSMMTSINLFSHFGIKPAKMFQIDAPEAVVAVLAGRADAMIFVGGKPVPMFKNLEQLANSNEADMHNLLEKVHFLPLSGKNFGELYEPATITSDDYSFAHTIIPTLAVRSVLVSYDFTLKDTSYYTMRCKQLGALGKALYNDLAQLQQTGHKKWKEVDFRQPLPLWQRDKCAWPSLQAAFTPSTPKPLKVTPVAATPPSPTKVTRTVLEKELLDILSH